MALPSQTDLEAAIAVTRFGLGARPGEIEAASANPRGFLKAQIRPEGADQPQGPLAPSAENMAGSGLVKDVEASSAQAT